MRRVPPRTGRRKPGAPKIARELRLSETTVRKRISNLVSRGLINIVAVPTPRAVGMNLSAIIGISILLPNLREITHQLKRPREVRYVGVSTGRYDIIVEAFFFDQQHRAWCPSSAGTGRELRPAEAVGKKLGEEVHQDRSEDAAVVAIDGEVRRWQLGQLRLAAGRVDAQRAVDADQGRPLADLVVRDRRTVG